MRGKVWVAQAGFYCFKDQQLNLGGYLQIYCSLGFVTGFNVRVWKILRTTFRLVAWVFQLLQGNRNNFFLTFRWGPPRGLLWLSGAYSLTHSTIYSIAE